MAALEMVDPEGTPELEALEADAVLDGDGSVVVPLVTALGEAQISVPPVRKWRSSARQALFSRGDDLTWAQSVLSKPDVAEWQRCDPDLDELERFIGAWQAATGEDPKGSRTSTGSSGSTRRR